jgi:hypothetical protein
VNIQACGEMSPEKKGEGIDQRYSPIDSPDGLAELVLPARSTQKSGFWGGFREILREEFSGYERTHEALNQGLVRAWNQNNPISWIMARVRCEILHLSPQEYARQMRDLTKSTLAGLEHEREFGRAKYNPEVIHRILQGWERISSERGDAVISLALGEAKHELLKLLTAKHGNTLYGTLSRWRYEVGPERFESATGLQYKTFWQRGKNLSVTDFSDLLGLAEKIGFISSSERTPQCSAELWSNPRVIELRNAWLGDSKARGRPIEVAKLHLLLSASGLKVDIETLGRGTEFKLQSIVVCSLAHFNLVPWKKVAPAFAALRKLGSFTEEQLAESKQRWQAAYKNRPDSFEDRLQTIAKERGLSNAQLADALGLRESYPLKPILPVFRALKYGEYSSLVTSGVLAHLIARSDKELSTLLEQKRSEVAASWRRNGSAITSPIAIEREIWNVSYADLSFSKEDIQRLEWGKSAAVSEAAIIQEVRRIGELRTAQPLSSLNQRQELLTVQGTIENLVYHYGLANLEKKLNTSQQFLNNCRRGEEVPSLPKFVSFLEKTGHALTENLEMDWREQIGRHLSLLYQSDTERVLSAHIVELADSRRQFFLESRAEEQKIVRFLHWLSESGTVDPRPFKKICNALGIEPHTSRGFFISSVAETGSVVSGVTRWLTTVSDPENVRAILLRFIESRTGVETGEIGEELRILRDLPGVTRGEIKEALRGSGSPESELQGIFIKRCAQQRISQQDILYAVGDNIKTERKPLGLVAKGLKQGLASAMAPLGTMAYLAGTNYEEVTQGLEEARTAVVRQLETLSIPSSALAIEMRLWGVRPEDIQFGRKDLHRAIWSADLPLMERALKHVSELGERKVQRTLMRLLYRKSATTPAEIVTCARESVQGGDRTINLKAGLNFGAPHECAIGADVPTFKQLGDIAALAGIKVSAAVELEWLWAYGDKLAKSGHTLFTRHLFASIAAQESPPDVSTKKSTMTTEKRLLSTFLRGSGLSQIVYRRAVKHARETGEITKEHKQALIEGFGYKEGSPEKIFIECCTDSPNMVKAIVRWRKRCATKSDIVQGFHALVDHARKTEPSKNEEHLAPIVNASIAALIEGRAGVIKPAVANSGALRLVALALCGVTRIELLNAADEYAQQERQEQKERAAVKQQQSIEMQKAASWEISPQMIALNFEARISLLAHRMLDKYKVSCDDLFKLFPDYGQPIRVIYNAVMHDTPWFVAALVCYNEPHEALMVMIQELRKGRVPKHDGSDHFKSQQEWIKGRGSLGKLNEGSLKLSFDFPFVRPIQAPEKASTRGRGKPL